MSSSSGKLKYQTEDLFQAVKKRKNSMVKRLLKDGVCVQDRDLYGETLLHVNASHGNYIITRRLIQAGCQINAINDECNTPLHVAVASNETEVARQLIRYGAVDLDAVNVYGESAICMAAVAENIPLVKILSEAGAKKNLALHWSVKNDFIEAAKILIHAGANVNDKDDRDDTVLHNALQHSASEEMITFLLNHGCNINGKDHYGRTALHLAASLNSRKNQSSTIKILLERGADANSYDSECYTPFHIIAAIGNKALVKLFLEHQADVMLVGPMGKTAAYCAIAHNRSSDAVKVVLESGISIDHPKNLSGHTLLHIASLICRPESIRQLVAKGFDVNDKDNDNATPLYYSTLAEILITDVQIEYYQGRDQLQSIQLLLEFGSDLNQKLLKDEKTILEIAIEEELFEECKVIIKHVAKLEARKNVPILDEFNRTVIERHPETKIFYDKCKAELTAMKNTKIKGTTVSLFSVMDEPLDVVAAYVRNKELVQGFESRTYQLAYPVYQTQLRAKFEKGMKRQKVLEKAATILSSTMPFVDPSHVAIEKILRYLSDKDIGIMINGN